MNVNFVQISPEDLTEQIMREVRKELKQLQKNFQPREPNVYLTRKEVAKMLNVDISTIHNWCNSKKLNPHYLGSRVYFLRSEIENSFTTNQDS